METILASIDPEDDGFAGFANKHIFIILIDKNIAKIDVL